MSRSTVDLRRSQLSTDTVSTAIQFLFHPNELIALLVRTVSNQELLSFYFRSFIGVLGWLHLPLDPPLAYPMLAVMLGVSTVLTVLWTRQQHWQLLFQQTQWLLIAMALLSALSVFLLLLVAWTPDPIHAQVIEGVQGRYFLVPALMVAMAVAPPQKQQQHLSSLMLTYVFGSVVLTISTALTLRVL